MYACVGVPGRERVDERRKMAMFLVFCTMGHLPLSFVSLQKEFTKQWGATAACTLRLAQMSTMSGQYNPKDGKKGGVLR